LVRAPILRVWGIIPQRVQGGALAAGGNLDTDQSAARMACRYCGMNHQHLLQKYDSRVPRYTSYPTAVQFSGTALNAADYAAWLASVPAEEAISLYLHVPFCDELCHYCGCNTVVVRGAAPKTAYTDALLTEIAMVASALGRPQKISHIHFGGGTPTALGMAELTRIMGALRQSFAVQAGAEIAIELDPRHLSRENCDVLGELGFTRASLGVQDFDQKVQKAAGRLQSFAMTAAAARHLREAGIAALNLDLMYGLPYQTEASLRATATAAITLDPARISVFGYAHVPWMKRHQNLLPQDALPGTAERFAQAEMIGNILCDAGYVAIGLDHFAKPGDAMAVATGNGTLCRNFQGYTVDSASTLLGLGASSIGALRQGYVQNFTSAREYKAAILANRFAVARGVCLTSEDSLRREAIMRLMCDSKLNIKDISYKHGADPALLLRAAPQFAQMQQDGILSWDGTTVTVPPKNRIFLRNVAACFDAYYAPESGRHARAI
jgi:oxygen-independent coproporphyrinogen-3 oxidase